MLEVKKLDSYLLLGVILFVFISFFCPNKVFGLEVLPELNINKLTGLDKIIPDYSYNLNKKVSFAIKSPSFSSDQVYFSTEFNGNQAYSLPFCNSKPYNLKQISNSNPAKPARSEKNLAKNGKSLQQNKAKQITGATKTSQTTKKIVNKTNTASGKQIFVTATAYSSTPDQTDGSPCTTANGFNVCKNGQSNVIAANFLPFGTKVTIPEVYGDRVFTVQDRMNRRYSNRIDIWMKSRSEAMSFGKRTVKIQVASLPDL